MSLYEPNVPPKTKSRAEARKERTDAKKAKQPGANPLIPKTHNQELLLSYLRSGCHVFATGGAGTGKTYLPSRYAARAVVEGRVSRIIICRPAVTKAKHQLGFRPGNTEAKMAEWMTPIMKGIREEVSSNTLDVWKANGKFEIVPFETMRGLTFDDAIVILDEAQNCDYNDLRMFLTRAGEQGQIVVTGDTDQIDVAGSGLAAITNMIFDYDLPVEVVSFTEEDCVRSPFAKAWLLAFKAEDERKKREAEARKVLTEAKLPEGDVTILDAKLGFMQRPIQHEAAAA